MYRLLLIATFLLSPLFPLYSQYALQINGKPVEEGEAINIFHDELIKGKVLFLLKSFEEGLEGVEISLDGGRNWFSMELTKEGFVYEYRPRDQESMRVVFLVKEKSGTIKTYNPYIKVVYYRKRPEEAIFILLDKMKMFYEQEKKNQFMSLFSSRFPNRVEFEESIQNDFYNYNNIRLRYRVDRKVFSSDLNSAIFDVYWERKCDLRDGTNKSDSATIAMRMEKEGLIWRITGLRNNTIFGSSLTSSPDLSISSSDITSPDGGYTINATIHNIGSAAATNFTVKFYYKPSSSSSYSLDATYNISKLDANSQTTITHSMSAVPPYTLKIVVDEENNVAESNENNNEATKNF